MRDYSSVENISGERGEALTLVLGSTKILIRSKIIAQRQHRMAARRYGVVGRGKLIVPFKKARSLGDSRTQWWRGICVPFRVVLPYSTPADLGGFSVMLAINGFATLPIFKK